MTKDIDYVFRVCVKTRSFWLNFVDDDYLYKTYPRPFFYILVLLEFKCYKDFKS